MSWQPVSVLVPFSLLGISKEMSVLCGVCGEVQRVSRHIRMYIHIDFQAD